MLIQGNISVEDNQLETRDAIGLSETDSFSITSKVDSELLMIEVPMR